MATATSDSIKLTEGFELGVEIGRDTYMDVNQITFKVIREDDKERRKRDTPTVDIEAPLQRPRPYSWRSTGQWTPDYDPQYGSLDVNYFDTDDAAQARASAVMLTLAADLLDAMHRQAAPQLEKQIKEHAAKLEAELKAEEAKVEKRSKLKEELQWFVGQKFKLKRDGFKATVFGTINRFTDTHVYTTSERGVRMDTRIDDINFFAIMYEGERRYTQVFERPAK